MFVFKKRIKVTKFWEIFDTTHNIIILHKPTKLNTKLIFIIIICLFIHAIYLFIYFILFYHIYIQGCSTQNNSND